MTTYSAVVTTGIYCRPGCGAKPRAENVRTFELPAAAEAAGFRACLRCRPYRVAGPIAYDAPEFVCRAVQLIIAGELDDGTEADLAARLGFSARHLRRLFTEHLGVTPDQLAQSRRAHFARRLLDDSELSVADIAFASGFGSLRQFNRTMRDVFRGSPRELRNRRRKTDRLVADGGLTMRLPFQPPFDWDATSAFLASRAVPGVESVEGAVYRRTISLDAAAGLVEVSAGGPDHLLIRLHLPYWEGLIHVVERVARMVGIDTDVGPAVQALSADPVIGPLVGVAPGLRVPGAWGPLEVAIQAIAAQEADPNDPPSAASTRTVMGGLVEHLGQPVPGLDHGLTHLFPSAEVLQAADLESIGLSRAVAEPIRALARAVAAGDLVLDGHVSLGEVVAALTGIVGVAQSAAQHVALRLGHRDAFPESDQSLRAALRTLGLSGPAEEIATRWQPWRALAAMHLMTYAGCGRDLTRPPDRPSGSRVDHRQIANCLRRNPPSADDQLRGCRVSQGPTVRTGLFTPEDRAASPYAYLPVDVPPGCAGLTVELEYDRSTGVLDLGCFGPAGFRGWSGGARSRYVITPSMATPGYLAGELEPGEWSVIMGLHRIPPTGVPWRVVVTLGNVDAETEFGPVREGAPPFPERPPRRQLPAEAGFAWLAGDLHAHTVHSDGDRTIDELAALGVGAGLDFLAVTDHNTISHHPLLAAAGARAGLTLIPGQEVTTHRGHANAFGDIGWIDFRQPAANWVREVAGRGGLLSINHPLMTDCAWRHPLSTPPPLTEIWHWTWLDRRWGGPMAWWLAWDPATIPVGGSDFHRPDQGRPSASR